MNEGQKYLLLLTIADGYAKNFCCENPDSDTIRIIASSKNYVPFRWQKKWLDFTLDENDVIVFNIENGCFGSHESLDYGSGILEMRKCIETAFLEDIVSSVEFAMYLNSLDKEIKQ